MDAPAPAPAPPPHVLIFPLPLQGHVNSMLKLAELLCLAGLHVTFLVSAQTHTRLLRFTNVHSRFNAYLGFRFETLPEEQPHSSYPLKEIFSSFKSTAVPFLRNFLESNHPRSDAQKPVTCIITDGVMSYAIDIAQEIDIPIIYFRTISACAFWAYFCIPELIEAGELPFNGDDMDVPIKKIGGMEDFLRRRDLPSFCRLDGMPENSFQIVVSETRQTTRAQALILNTFEDLEGRILSHVRTKCPKVYTIGPLHAHLKARLTTQSNSSNSLWEEDRSCMGWLDEQPPKSVIYVSFGSITMVTRDQLMEFWHGLVNSEKRFLWVIRPESIAVKDKENQIPAELEEGTKTRGYMVGWAPQEEVLAHPAIGGFLTHSGWNSTLESIVEGVPMICWPYFADQPMNSRFVGEVWKLGLDMKDTCDRVIIKKMIKDLMEVRRDEFVRATDQTATVAKMSVSQGGSSHRNLDLLVEDIRLMRVQSERT